MPYEEATLMVSLCGYRERYEPFCLFVSSFCSPDMQMIEAILSLLAVWPLIAVTLVTPAEISGKTTWSNKSFMRL